MFRLNTEGQLTSGEWCMKASKKDAIPSPTVTWEGQMEHGCTRRIVSRCTTPVMKKCLAVHPETSQLLVRECDQNNEYHRWGWKEVTPLGQGTRRK